MEEDFEGDARCCFSHSFSCVLWLLALVCWCLRSDPWILRLSSISPESSTSQITISPVSMPPVWRRSLTVWPTGSRSRVPRWKRWEAISEALIGRRLWELEQLLKITFSWTVIWASVAVVNYLVVLLWPFDFLDHQ